MVPSMLRVLVGLAPCLCSAGWGDGRSTYWSRSYPKHEQSNYGKGYRQYSYSGSGKGGYGGYSNGNSMAEAVSFLADALGKSTSRRSHRGRSSSGSRSRSSSRKCRRASSSATRKELEELKRYREEEAARKAAEQKKAEKEANKSRFKELEERLLSALPGPPSAKTQTSAPKSCSGAAGHSGPQVSMSGLVAKLIEALTDKRVCCKDFSSWDELEQLLAALDTQALKDILVSHSEPVPRDKPQRVSKVMEFLVRECSA